MDHKSDRIRVDLTDAQKKQIKEEAGANIESLEFTATELEERIAPFVDKLGIKY